MSEYRFYMDTHRLRISVSNMPVLGLRIMSNLARRLPTEALSEYDFYMDTHRLRISVSNMKNANTRDKLEAIRVSVLSNLSKLPPAPSAPLAPRPPSNFPRAPRLSGAGLS